jgi:hypothetical protein
VLNRIQLLALSALVVLGANATLLFYGKDHLPNDWGYFNSLSLVVRSIVLNYGTFPLHNPWVCGGLDILSNPQSRVFSPFVLFDIVFAPQNANLASLFVYGCLGFLGTFLALGRLGCREVSCFLGATLFACCSWFALHYYEGHIAFGAMQILPLVLLALLEIKRPAVIMLTALVESLVLLDGGVNAVIFSILLGLSLLFFIPRCRDNFVVSLRRHPKYWVFAIVGAALLTAPKTLPVLIAAARRNPVLDYYSMSLQDVGIAFLNPFKSIDDRLPTSATSYQFHEFGCYVSLVGIAIILIAARLERGFFARNSGWFFGALFWFWVGSGWIAGINPWKAFHHLPLINNAHVQSRVFLIMYFFLVIAIAKAFDALLVRSRRYLWLLPILIMEAALVRNIPATSRNFSGVKPPGRSKLISSQTIKSTVPFAFHPSFYLDQPNTGASHCYEPSFVPTRIMDTSHRDYKGEIWTQNPDVSHVALTKFVPGRIEFDYVTTEPTVVRFNTNALFNWDVIEGSGTAKGEGTELLEFIPEKPTSEHVVLIYRPAYLKYALTGFFVGAFIFLVAIWSALRGPKNDAGVVV